MIKSIYYIIFFVINFALISCTSENKTESKILTLDTIKIGMTYDEVEKILNKPSSIVRGINELVSTTNQLAIINNYGTLLYVVWIYNQEKIDTGSYRFVDYKLVSDTTYYKEYKYYQGGSEISEEKYNRILASREKEKNDTLLNKRSKSTRIEIQKKTLNRSRIDERYEVGTVYQVNYDIITKLAVIFDASSGRVVDRKYMPIIVVPKDTIDIKNKLLKDTKKIS